jgi:hypothetical protein
MKRLLTVALISGLSFGCFLWFWSAVSSTGAFFRMLTSVHSRDTQRVSLISEFGHFLAENNEFQEQINASKAIRSAVLTPTQRVMIRRPQPASPIPSPATERYLALPHLDHELRQVRSVLGTDSALTMQALLVTHRSSTSISLRDIEAAQEVMQSLRKEPEKSLADLHHAMRKFSLVANSEAQVQLLFEVANSLYENLPENKRESQTSSFQKMNELLEQSHARASR